MVSFDVAAIGWDVGIVYDTPDTQLDPKDNWTWITTWVALGGSLVLTAIATGMTIATWGATAPAVGASGALVLAAIAAIDAVGAGVAAGSLGVTIAAGAAAVVQAALSPTTFKGWYGGDDYRTVVHGGFDFQKTDSGYEISDAQPLSIHWANLTQGTSGDITKS